MKDDEARDDEDDDASRSAPDSAATTTRLRIQTQPGRPHLQPVSKVDKASQRVTMSSMKRLLSVPEVAASFEVTSQTVRNWIADGRLAAIQPTPRGRYRITPEAAQALRREVTPASRGGMSVERVTRDRHQRRSAIGFTPALSMELDHIVAAIVAAVHPETVYLFGSRARGDAGPDSDLDIALVVPDGSPRRRVAMKSYESLAAVRGRSVGVEVVVLTPQLIAAERDLVGSIARAVIREGVALYGPAVV